MVKCQCVPFSDRGTSWEAAQSILEPPEFLRAKAKKAVLKAILKATKGKTCDELETDLGMSHQTVSARIRDLVRDGGYIMNSGERRRTRSGRFAIVWKESTP